LPANEPLIAGFGSHDAKNRPSCLLRRPRKGREQFPRPPVPRSERPAGGAQRGEGFLRHLDRLPVSRQTEIILDLIEEQRAAKGCGKANCPARPSQPRHFALTIAVRSWWLCCLRKAEPVEEHKESGIILDLTRCGQRLNNRAAILQSKIT